MVVQSVLKIKTLIAGVVLLQVFFHSIFSYGKFMESVVRITDSCTSVFSCDTTVVVYFRHYNYDETIHFSTFTKEVV